MTGGYQGSNSLPEEFRTPPARFSFFRVLLMVLVMGVSAIIVSRVFPNVRLGEKHPTTDDIRSEAINSGDVKNPVFKDIKKPSPVTEEVIATTGDVLGHAANFTSFSNEINLEIFNQASLPRLTYHPNRKRAFVAGSVVNLRDRPNGRLVGQLINGEEVSILEWPKDSTSVKIATNRGMVAYVSADLLSYEQYRGVFSSPVEPLGFDAFALKSTVGSSTDEFNREYENFKNLLRGLPTKVSFDYAESNLKYVLVASSSVIFPADPSVLLSLVRAVSTKPSVFFERPKHSQPGPLDPELEIRANPPVRRVLENGSSKSTRFDRFLISKGCPTKRVAAVTADGTASAVELLVFDIKKKVRATLSTKPHRGNPSYTWAYADLNGDSWQDAAFYFGGETGMSPYRFMFVAHNVEGVWQMHWVEDRTGADVVCYSVNNESGDIKK